MPETKIYTIRKLEFSGKWIEFWFEERKHIIDTEDGKEDKWIECCKIYMLDQVVEEAGITPYELQMQGYNMLIGKKVEWSGDRPIKLIK